MFFAVRSNDSFNFPLGLIKYIVIVIVCDLSSFGQHVFLVLYHSFFSPAFSIEQIHHRLILHTSSNQCIIVMPFSAQAFQLYDTHLEKLNWLTIFGKEIRLCENHQVMWANTLGEKYTDWKKLTKESSAISLIYSRHNLNVPCLQTSIVFTLSNNY